MKIRITPYIKKHWYEKKSIPLTFILMPFSIIFRILVAIRYQYYRFKHYCFKPFKPYPVIVIGNLSVGGGGKTPLVIETVNFLKSEGYRPAVLSRGYRRQTKTMRQVQLDDKISDVGDEPYLIHQKTGVPVFVCADRARGLIEIAKRHIDCNIIISDDGLQHYGLARDIEILVYDSSRKFANTYLLPMGPLREPMSRLQSVDLIVSKGVGAELFYSIELTGFRNLYSNERQPINFFQSFDCIAVAGIADPNSFFNLLKKYELSFTEKPFPDHHDYEASDFDFGEADCILLTAKDAVKCRSFHFKNLWVAETVVEVTPRYFEALKIALCEVPILKT